MLAFVTPSLDPAHPTLAFARSWVRALHAEAGALRVLAREGAPFAELPELDLRIAFPTGHRGEQSSLARRVRWAWFLRKNLRDVDAVLAHMVPRDALWARRLGKRELRVALWYAHGKIGPSLAPALRACDLVFTPDPGSFPIRDARVRCVGHGIDLARFVAPDDLPGAEAPLLFAARIAARKEPALAIEAWRAWRARVPSTARALEIAGAPLTAGDGALDRELRARTAGDRDVRWLGAEPWAAMPARYARAALLLAPSRTGSLDKNVLEAHACGVPAVVLAESGAADVVAAVDPEAVCHDARPAAMAEVVEALLSLPDVERRARAAKRRDLVARDHDLAALGQRIVHEIAHA